MQATPRPLKLESRRVAFTLVELLVVVSVLVLLAFCLVPALARTRPETGAFQCLNNYRQLVRAWRIYSDDNNDRLPGNLHGFGIMANNPNAPWAQGWLDWTLGNNNTNTVLLTDPSYASIANYCSKDARLFKCPADQFLSGPQRSSGWKQRVRSVIANIYIGGLNVESGPTDPVNAVAKKWTDLTNPKPSETWLLMDEHPDSINDPAFFPPRIGQWIDLPGNNHDGGAGVAYADGAAEIHRWQASALNQRVGFTDFPLSVIPTDPDVLWLRARTPKQPGFN